MPHVVFMWKIVEIPYNLHELKGDIKDWKSSDLSNKTVFIKRFKLQMSQLLIRAKRGRSAFLPRRTKGKKHGNPKRR